MILRPHEIFYFSSDWSHGNESDISFILIVYYYISNCTQIALIMRQTQTQSRIVEHCWKNDWQMLRSFHTCLHDKKRISQIYDDIQEEF